MKPATAQTATGLALAARETPDLRKFRRVCLVLFIFMEIRGESSFADATR
jgi:hypothetical protein